MQDTRNHRRSEVSILKKPTIYQTQFAVFRKINPVQQGRILQSRKYSSKLPAVSNDI